MQIQLNLRVRNLVFRNQFRLSGHSFPYLNLDIIFDSCFIVVNIEEGFTRNSNLYHSNLSAIHCSMTSLCSVSTAMASKLA